jgi:hypothetical protein
MVGVLKQGKEPTHGTVSSKNRYCAERKQSRLAQPGKSLAKQSRKIWRDAVGVSRGVPMSHQFSQVEGIAFRITHPSFDNVGGRISRMWSESVCQLLQGEVIQWCKRMRRNAGWQLRRAPPTGENERQAPLRCPFDHLMKQGARRAISPMKIIDEYQ